MRLFLLALVVWCLSETAYAEKQKRKPSSKSKPKAAPLLSSGASGDDGDYVIQKKGNTTIKYKKKTTYDFEGANIDGIYNKPSGSYISNIKDVKARSIIRVRENFDAEVIDSARQLK